MIPRIRINDLPPPSTPWIADWRSYDIPETVAAGIRATSSWGNCVAFTLRPYGGARMVRVAEREARRCNIRLLWVLKGNRKKPK